MEFLLSVITIADASAAVDAVKALVIYRRDDAVRAKVIAAVESKNNAVVRKALETEFA